jgi:hypothetical protein
MNLTDWVGIIGVTFILLAYLLVIWKLLETNSLYYILLNLAGGSMACLASMMIRYTPFIILEGAWTLVSLIAFIKFIRKKYAW